MRKTFATAFKLIALSAIALATADANALPLVWRADWPGSKPIETLVHRGTDIEFQPQWYINGELANSTNWTFQTFVQTNAQATGQWFGPLPGAAFSHTNDIGAAFYNVMVRAQMPGGAVNYTAFARLRMLDSPGFTPGELHLPVAVLDFAQVEVRNAEMIVPDISSNILIAAASYTDGATNALGQTVATNAAAISTNAANIATLNDTTSTLSDSTATNSAAIATLKDTTATNSAAIATLKDTTATLSDTTATINSKIPSAASASNQLADKAWIDDEIDTYAAYYITYTAAGAAFPTRTALTNAAVVYSGGAARTPTRNDYAVVLADESHGGAEWRYIYTVAAGATSGQWDAQYPIETNDYDGLSNKPQINGVSLSGNKTGADLGVLNLAGGTMTGAIYLRSDSAYLTENELSLFNKAPTGNVTNTTYTSLSTDGIYRARYQNGEFIETSYFRFPASGEGFFARDADIAAAATAATNYTDAAISPTSPAFSNAVLSVGLGIDTNTVAVINELVDSAHDLPVTGATSVGALLLALAAAVAALKKRLSYSLVSAPSTTSGTTQTVTLADRANNSATQRSGITTVALQFPDNTNSDKARDFILALTCGATSPNVTFPAGATIVVDDATDLTAEEGLNLYSFTEISANTFVACRKLVAEYAA